MRNLGEWPLSAVPPLIQNLASPPVEKPNLAPPAAEKWIGKGVNRHLGQMGSSFGLSPSQRRAVHAFFAAGDSGASPGNVLAIDGPPGTGKTTLLQSLVASLWVESACVSSAEEAKPPLTLAVSNNNQAVTNILDTFQKVTVPPGDSLEDSDRKDSRALLHRRWIPGLPSFGLYFPAQNRIGKSAFPAAVRRRSGAPFWNGFPEEVRSRNFQDLAAKEYLALAGEFFGGKFASLQEAVEHLHRALLLERQRLDDLLKRTEAVEALRRAWKVSDVGGLLRALEGQVGKLEEEVAGWQTVEIAVGIAFDETPTLQQLFHFLPSFRQRNYSRLTAPLRDRGLPVPPNRGNPRRIVPSFVQDERARREGDLKDCQEQLATVRIFLETLLELQGTLPVEHGLRQDAGRLERWEWLAALLDCTLRNRLFLLAGRYWEGRWILEESALRLRIQQGGRDTQEDTLRRLAMLMPCFVSTFYMAPVVAPWRPKHADTLDVLIVDEAGQASPEVGAAVFALAKRAVVVGDVHQIEPVWNVDRPVDSGNVGTLDLPPSHRAWGGNLMAVAHRVTAFTTSPAGQGGVLLREHRRCSPQIIAYCNDLVYGGALEPLRPAPDDPPLPAFGCGHIRSLCERRGSSLANRGEARVIAHWLSGRKEELERAYDGPLGEIAGIVTPFRSQVGELQVALRREGLAGITVGTVHTFQGAERSVILFSPVYSTRDHPSGLFFDHSPNLLNVAVSRARDAFLVMGDLGLFDPARPDRPSGLLAQHLFREGEALPDVVAVPRLLDLPEVQRLATLDEHRATLRQALEESRERILIVSPFLSPKALAADAVEAGIAKAVARGVAVTVIHDPSFDSIRQENASDAANRRERAVRRLAATGAEVWAVPRTHQKTLAVDDRWLVEGSFNWLSSPRETRWSRCEASLRCNPPQAAALIEEAWRPFMTEGRTRDSSRSP